MEEVSDVVHPGHSRGIRTLAWVGLVVIVGSMVAFIVAFFVDSDEPNGEPGELEESAVPVPSDLVVPPLSDVTAEWGLTDWLTVGREPLRGGSSLADLDLDGDLDLVVAGGDVGLFEWTGSAFERSPQTVDVGDAVSAHVGDVDSDGVPDLLFGSSDGAFVAWGESWFSADSTAELTPLPASGTVSGVVPADFGNGPAILVLGYRDGQPAPDLILEMDGRTVESAAALPNSDRLSTVAAIADLTGDGSTDIWVGRDLGWREGGDSVYSRTGVADEWVDVAPELGAALEIDSMGLTLADLDADGLLDAYASDLGDNELLQAGPDGFEKVSDVGAARIRSAGAADNEISRSWGSGAVDWNLDGRLDLVVVNGGFSDISVPNKVVNKFILESDPPAILLATSTGSYVDAWPIVGPEWSGRSRGLSLGDVDGDGDVDMVVVDHEGGLHALRNDGSVIGEAWTAPVECVSSGAEAVVVTDAGGWTVLTHQLSFLGSHAPQVVAPPGATIGTSCEG